MAWRDEPATERQLDCIRWMMEFSAYPIPYFKGKTKGEAADYIDRYWKSANEDVNSKTFGY